MPGIARLGDPTSCQGIVIGPGSPTVFADKIPIHLLGDTRTNVTCGAPPGIPPIVPAIMGSPTVFATKKPVVRKDDPDAVGGKITVASTTVFADG